MIPCFLVFPPAVVFDSVDVKQEKLNGHDKLFKRIEQLKEISSVQATLGLNYDLHVCTSVRSKAALGEA